VKKLTTEDTEFPERSRKGNATIHVPTTNSLCPL
jgi:hypothetical protein